MGIITIRRLREFWEYEPDAKGPLTHWYKWAKSARWRTFVDTRQTFRHADLVKENSGNTVTIFNVGGNKYTLITAVHFPKTAQQMEGRVYILSVLTHADYDEGAWRLEL